MTLKNSHELEATRHKLQQLEKRIAAIRNTSQPFDHATELTIRSLTQLANQFKEEVSRFEAHISV